MNFRTLDLNLLRVFDTVMAEGSLTRAAEVLAITQPAASHAIKRLHGAVGETLFVRTAFGMKPTDRAEALWPQVRAALADLRRVLAPEVFDPLADTHEGAENDNSEMAQVMKLYRHVLRKENMAGIVVHHTHDPERYGTIFRQGDIENYVQGSDVGGCSLHRYVPPCQHKSIVSNVGV